MKRAPSKKTRERAAVLCAVAASNPHGRRIFESMREFDDDKARELMEDAFFAVPWNDDICMECGQHTDARFVWAEAEAMLRTGWCPP